MVLTWDGRQIVALLKGVWPISKWGPPWVVCVNGIALSILCKLGIFKKINKYASNTFYESDMRCENV